MKIVLDTNVLISGVFFTGPPYQILKAWQDGKIKITASEEILSEYQRVAEELSLQFPTVDIDRILELITVHAEIVDASDFQVTICEDPDDNKFIACALASRSKIIISGDKHLINVSGHKGIQVVKPREFTDNYLKKR